VLFRVVHSHSLGPGARGIHQLLYCPRKGKVPPGPGPARVRATGAEDPDARAKKSCGGNFRATLNVHSVRTERFGKDAPHDHA
jgi:hypothetical protein